MIGKKNKFYKRKFASIGHTLVCKHKYMLKNELNYFFEFGLFNT